MCMCAYLLLLQPFASTNERAECCLRGVCRHGILRVGLRACTPVKFQRAEYLGFARFDVVELFL